MNEDQFNTLTPEEERVIVHKGTERPYTREYDNFFLDGTYNRIMSSLLAE